MSVDVFGAASACGDRVTTDGDGLVDACVVV